MHGKLIDGRLVHAPAYVVEGDRTVYNPSPATLEAHGWLPIVETPCPELTEESTICYMSEWQEQDGQIVQVWVESEPAPIVYAPTIEQRVSALEDVITMS